MEASVITLLFLLFAVVMFVWEKIPLGVTSMIVCIGLVVTGVLDWKTAFAGFVDSNVILFVAMFIVGGALFETGMANKIGGVVTHFAKSEKQLIIAIMIITGVMSRRTFKYRYRSSADPGSHRNRRKIRLFQIKTSDAACICGGYGRKPFSHRSAGQPHRPVGDGRHGESIWIFRVCQSGSADSDCRNYFLCTVWLQAFAGAQGRRGWIYDETKDFGHVPKWKQNLSLIILVLTLIGMIFEKQIGIKLCVIGAVGALALILTGVISEKDALKSIDLKTIFLFGGTLSLASALEETGAGEMIADKVIGLLGANPSPYLLTFVVFMLCCVLTNFMSNTATTALMVPICVSIANRMGADPSAVLMACVIGGSCAYATPIGMPANTMVVTAGGYTFKDYAKAGIPLILVATVVSMILLPVLYPFFP